MRFRLLATLVLLTVAACSGAGEDGAPAVGSTGEGGGSSTTLAAGDAARLPRSAPGRGAVAFGQDVYEFTVSSCVPTPNDDEPEAARTLFQLDGKGTARGNAFTISVRRFQTKTTATTFTDTITYRDTARVFQAQRVEVDGGVTDPRDPNAATPLLQIDDAHVSASGLFGAPGNDTGAIAGRLDATCAIA